MVVFCFEKSRSWGLGSEGFFLPFLDVYVRKKSYLDLLEAVNVLSFGSMSLTDFGRSRYIFERVMSYQCHENLMSFDWDVLDNAMHQIVIVNWLNCHKDHGDHKQQEEEAG